MSALKAEYSFTCEHCGLNRQQYHAAFFETPTDRAKFEQIGEVPDVICWVCQHKQTKPGKFLRFSKDVTH